MIEYFLSGISTWLQGAEFRQNQLAKRSEVLSALKYALRSTKKHISDTRTEFGDVESKELADKWSIAAKLIRPFNDDVASTLEQKSDYWTNPYGFKSEIQNGERRFDFRFRITEVEKMIRQLENNWKKL
jgi:hypothetical protein